MTALVSLTEHYEARWLVSTPCADESLRSVLGRAADLYGQEPDILWTGLLGAAQLPPCAIDDPSTEAIDALAYVLAVQPGRLNRLRLPAGQRSLDHGRRHPFCPRCWRADDAAGRPRHFRRAWAKALSLRCELHGTPLVAWHASRHQFAPRSSDDISLHELLVDGVEKQPEVRDALAYIHDFADRVARCGDDESMWPSDWNGTLGEALRDLVQVMTPDGPVESSWLSQTYTSAALRPFIHPGPSVPEAGGSEGWERFCRTTDPATRRMALWLIGSWVVPSWPDQLRAPLPPI